MARRTLLVFLTIASLTLFALPVSADPIISSGTPTTTVPTFLTDGSYLFGITVPDPLPAGEFLEPVDISESISSFGNSRFSSTTQSSTRLIPSTGPPESTEPNSPTAT